jgi:hypothetical protein
VTTINTSEATKNVAGGSLGAITVGHTNNAKRAIKKTNQAMISVLPISLS